MSGPGGSEAGRFDAAAVLEHMADGFLAFDADWCCIFANAAAEALLGAQRSELIGRSAWPPPIALGGTRAEPALRQARDRGEVATFDFEFAGRWCNARLYPLPGTAMALRLRDISAQRAAQLALQQNEERLRLAIGATGLGTWDHDLLTDRRIWSDGARALLGIPPELEPSRALLGGLIHPEDEPRTAALYAAALDPGGDGSYRNEIRIRRYDTGEERWIALNGRVLFDPSGRPVRALGIARDVTETRRTEEVLRRAKEELEARVAQRTEALEAANRELAAERARLGAILEQLPFGVLVVDRAGALVIQNEAARRLMGRDMRGVHGWRDFEGIGAIRPDGTPLPARDYALVRAVRTGAVTSRRLQPFATGDGRRVTFELSAAPVRDEAGEIVLGVLALEDVTARLEAEEALRRAQRLEAVGQLTGGVAHDFNNLLTAILGNLELLGRQVEQPRARRLLENAMRAADRGAKLTAQLLAFARQQRLEPQPVDLNETVRSVAALLRSTFSIDTEIALALAPDLPPALTDPTQVELMVLNLAINARDAMAAGGRIVIRTARERLGAPARPEDPPAGDYVAIAVSDTGSGMTPEVLARAFEPFFTTKGVGGGSGLGLAQVLGVAQQLGGGVRLASTPGSGTVATVFFPVAGAAAPSAGAG